MLVERHGRPPTPALTFTEWVRFLSDECVYRYGRTITDLPELDLPALHAAGIRPVTVARLGFAAIDAERARRVREELDLS